ncbi:MAG: hypothetical protein FJ295_07925 [Planctomycetes bacterium]|nr:hypothetical protein [Planctomycetota bacterium]
MSRFQIVAALGWLLMAAAVVVAMVVARDLTLAAYGSQAARQEWETWRKVAQEQSQGGGPVQRRVPKSVEPPALVLMRDHFAVILPTLMVLLSCVYFTLAWMFAGVVRAKRSGLNRGQRMSMLFSEPPPEA